MTTWTIGLLSIGPSKSAVQQDGRIINNYRQTWLMKAMDASEFPTESQITTALGIYPGSPYANDSNATCHDATINHVFSAPPYLLYHVDLEWSTAAALPVENSTDPTTRRTIWSQKANIQQRYLTLDAKDIPIVNSAGQPPDGGVPYDVRLGTVTAKKNIASGSFNQDTSLAQSGYVNSATFLGGAAGTVQMDIDAQEVYEGAYHYWEVTYTFSYDPKGWQPKFPNAGFFQRSGLGSNTLVRIIGSDIGDTEEPDAPVLEPEPLDCDGLLVTIANRAATTSSNVNTANYLSYTQVANAYGTMDLTTLGL